ncbi:DUF6474 family protein [Gordonia sp. VNK21]|uniref:DUF6474 family protein n=1 Tax=Gordonia sp. VNK21 TaxID=3382483 RepID=UPI0038D446F1
MGLLSSRRTTSVERKASATVRRAERKAAKKVRKAERKLVKERARAEAKFSAREENRARKKALRTERKHNKKSHRDERKTAKVAGKAQEKAAAAETKKLAAEAKNVEKTGALAPAKIRRYLTAARLVAPIAGPLAYRAGTAAREQLVEFQARRAGVSATALSAYGGPSAALRARIDAARSSAQQVSQVETTDEGRAFVGAMSERLDNLKVAVDAADTMPPSQRRAAQRAIENELAAIDSDLLARLNVHP